MGREEDSAHRAYVLRELGCCRAVKRVAFLPSALAKRRSSRLEGAGVCRARDYRGAQDRNG
eukprot:6210547-Pleurochrysis_carterae.AAC.2